MNKKELYYEPVVLLSDGTETALLKLHIQKLNRKIECLEFALEKCSCCGEHDSQSINQLTKQIVELEAQNKALKVYWEWSRYVDQRNFEYDHPEEYQSIAAMTGEDDE